MDDPLKIIIDTREQTPFHWDASVASVRRATLKTGDYALDGDDGFAVERKSLDDFLGTIGSGWARFKREVARARSAGFRLAIVVEGCASDCMYYYGEDDGNIFPPINNHPLMSPGLIVKRIGQLFHLGASVMFCDQPLQASAITWYLLRVRRAVLDGEEIDD